MHLWGSCGIFLLVSQCKLGVWVSGCSVGISACNTEKERCTSTFKQVMDAIWAPTWQDSKSIRTGGYILWAFYTHRHPFQSGFNFKHLIVFIDISDIHNETVYFRTENGVISKADGVKIARDESISWTSQLKNFYKNNFSLFTNLLREFRQRLGGRANTKSSIPVYSDWTYNKLSSGFVSMSVENAINKAVREMNLLYEFLKIRDIKLSVGVYPWPEQLAEMSRNNSHANLQVEIWREFCADKCVKFINMYPEYFHQILKSSVNYVYEAHFIPGDVHFNEAGNRLIYEELLDVGL